MNITDKRIDDGKAFDWGRTSGNGYFSRTDRTGQDAGRRFGYEDRLSGRSDGTTGFCPQRSFDVITACQCFWYFDHERVMPKLSELLKPDGKLLILHMAWLPYDDKIAGASEELVLIVRIHA